MKAPTDLEWMMFHDGELDEPRRSELASLLEVEATPSKKLRGLEVLGVLVRSEPATEVNLTDVIMGRIATAESSAKPRVVPEQPVVTKSDAPVANDNGKLLFGLTGLAAAAAVALFVWGGSEPGPSLPAEPVAQVQEAPPVVATAAAADRAPIIPREDAPALEESGLPAVEVASVDFGSRVGAVIYMDEPKGATTTVVWLTDD